MTAMRRTIRQPFAASWRKDTPANIGEVSQNEGRTVSKAKSSSNGIETSTTPKNPMSMRRAARAKALPALFSKLGVQQDPSVRISRRAHFFLQPSRSQQPKIREVESVNPISTALGRTAHQQRVVNLRSAPSPISDDPERLDVILFADGHGLEMRQNVVGNDAYR